MKNNAATSNQDRESIINAIKEEFEKAEGHTVPLESINVFGTGEYSALLTLLPR